MSYNYTPLEDTRRKTPPTAAEIYLALLVRCPDRHPIDLWGDARILRNDLEKIEIDVKKENAQHRPPPTPIPGSGDKRNGLL